MRASHTSRSPPHRHWPTTLPPQWFPHPPGLLVTGWDRVLVRDPAGRPEAPNQKSFALTHARPIGGGVMKWVTRENANVDRIACPWLIKRFIDPEAEFLFVPKDQV